MKNNFKSIGAGSIQWLFFLLATMLTFPIIIGEIYHLSTIQIMGLIQRTFFVVAITTLLQIKFGHKLPIIEGPTGIWLSIFIILAGLSSNQGAELHQVLKIIEGGILTAGLILISLSALDLIKNLLSLFTPLVSGLYLILLPLQLSGTFIKGMLGINNQTLEIDPVVAIISVSVFVLVLLLSFKAKGFLKSYAVLIGILLGWILFLIFGKALIINPKNTVFALPSVFAWGLPDWNSGIILSTVIITLILVSNAVATMTAIGESIKKKTDSNTHKRGIFMGGITHILSSLFSTAGGLVPLPITAGFISLSGHTQIMPLIIACIFLAVISFFPVLIGYLALLPGPVAYAVSFASFIQIISIGFHTIFKNNLQQKHFTILGISLMFGIGIMFIPSTVINKLPLLVQYIGSNGLITGTMLCILLEQLT